MAAQKTIHFLTEEKWCPTKNNVYFLGILFQKVINLKTPKSSDCLHS